MQDDGDKRKPMGCIGVINIGLSFLLPFVGIQGLIPLAWQLYYQGEAQKASGWINWMPLIFLLSVTVGVVNAVLYCRKKYRG